MDHGRIVVIRKERAGLATLFPLGVEHEVVDDELTATVKEIREAHLAVCPLEDVILSDLLPRQLTACRTELVAQSGEFLLLLEERLASLEPVGRGNYGMTRRCQYP
jgi:hypothetical protein